MWASNVFLLLPLAAKVLASPAPVPVPESGLPEYGVHELQWEVEVFPGQVMNFTGTVESVDRQAAALNPTYREEYLERHPDVSAEKTLDTRWTSGSWKMVLCKPGHGWTTGNIVPAVNGVNYLKKAVGEPSSSPGPGRCGRVSCSYQTAIWWCNDNPRWKNLESFARIAQGAEMILKACGQALGQHFATDNWNVIVRKDDC